MENLQEQIQQAKALERAQKNEAALDIFLSLSQKPGPHAEDPAFWLQLGNVGRRTDKPAVAAEAYPRAIDLLERADHRNSAFAVARRLARTAPDSADVHLRLAALAASLGYAREARDASLRAAELGGNGQSDAAVECLRAAWALLQRDGLNQDAEQVRTRIMALRPGADPLEDASLEEQARAAPSPDDLKVVDGVESLSAAAPEPGLQSTPLPDVDADGGIDRLEGLEPTHAGHGWDAGSGDEDVSGYREVGAELPGHPDLPLLSGEPEESAAEGAAEDDLPFLDTGADSRSGASKAASSERVEPPAAEPEVGEPAAAEPEAPPPRTAEPAPAAAPAAPAEPTSPAKGREPADGRPASKPEHAPTSTTRNEPEPGGDYVDLGALVMSDDEAEEEDGTRFQMDAAQHPSGDEDKDFAEILGMFRQKVSQSIHPQDSSSHYDLGLAFKEMGLYDDAIGQLQLALSGGANPVATLEVLGECFIQKGEDSLAARVLGRAVRIPDASESDLLGVLYWLGRTQEVLESPAEARGYYERVIAVDIGFRDAAARLNALRGGSAPSR